MTASFFHEEEHDGLVSRGPLKKRDTRLLYVNRIQSDDDSETNDVFPGLCDRRIRRSANRG